MRARSWRGIVLLVAGGLLGAGGLVLAASPAVLAHHGWSGYDASRLVTLRGTVQSVSFGSPHCQLALASEDKVWRVVLAPPSRMERRGLPSGSIKAGQQAAVAGYPHRSEVAEFRAERISLDGGPAVELR